MWYVGERKEGHSAYSLIWFVFFFFKKKKGLAFHAFAGSLQELEAALGRMSGETDGVVDALFNYTTNTHSNYYYCPTVQQLKQLAVHVTPTAGQ